MKGRAVAGGNKQRDYISKEDASSPTAATESILLISVIAAEEKRDVAIVDIPNAFIQTRVEREEDKVIIRVRGYLVDVLCKIWSGYKEYVTTNSKGEKQLLLQCENAIYGTIIASLLFYNKFCKTLKTNGFELNPYEPCVGNRMVNDVQQTCGFHVDDVMLTCADVSTNDHFIETLREEYESVFEDGSGKMTVHRGKVHDYLGMRLDFSVEGQVKVSMFDYVDKILSDWEKRAPDDQGKKTSAAPRDLFVVDEDCAKLEKKQAEDFHYFVAKTLFATKRARPDTGTSISYLTTRVRGPDLRRLEEVEAFDELFEWNPKAAPDPECGWNRDFEVVGGRLLCCPSEHERPHRWWFDIGTWDSNAQFDEAEVEHPEFD